MSVEALRKAATVEVACRRYRDGRESAFTDVVALETSVAVTSENGPSRTLWAAPIDLETLVLGHAVLEWGGEFGLPIVEERRGNVFRLRFERRVLAEPDPNLPGSLSREDILALMREFIRQDGLWDGTGCFHRAGLADSLAKTLIARAEDIGRHNCMDRLAGWALREKRILAETALFLSARVTASMLQKAMAAGFRMIVSRSAVTTASVDMAQAAGITLLGFARENENRFTIFSDPKERIKG